MKSSGHLGSSLLPRSLPFFQHPLLLLCQTLSGRIVGSQVQVAVLVGFSHFGELLQFLGTVLLVVLSLPLLTSLQSLLDDVHDLLVNFEVPSPLHLSLIDTQNITLFAFCDVWHSTVLSVVVVGSVLGMLSFNKLSHEGHGPVHDEVVGLRQVGDGVGGSPLMGWGTR